jgi:hypothetical protein
MGARDTDSTAFTLPAGTIVVDNRDEGFRVVESRPWIERFRPRRESTVSRSRYGTTRPRYHRWTEYTGYAAHGDSIKSLHQRRAGTGKSRVEWTTTIEEGGAYDLHVFASHQVPPGVDDYQLKATFHYSVSTPGEEPVEVPLKLFEAREHWVHLGRFRVAPGACTVSLDDRVTAPGFTRPAGMPEEIRHAPPTLHVYADAIRWTRVETP